MERDDFMSNRKATFVMFRQFLHSWCTPESFDLNTDCISVLRKCNTVMRGTQGDWKLHSILNRVHVILFKNAMPC